MLTRAEWSLATSLAVCQVHGCQPRLAASVPVRQVTNSSHLPASCTRTNQRSSHATARAWCGQSTSQSIRSSIHSSNPHLPPPSQRLISADRFEYHPPPSFSLPPLRHLSIPHYQAFLTPSPNRLLVYNPFFSNHRPFLSILCNPSPPFTSCLCLWFSSLFLSLFPSKKRKQKKKKNQRIQNKKEDPSFGHKSSLPHISVL